MTDTTELTDAQLNIRAAKAAGYTPVCINTHTGEGWMLAGAGSTLLAPNFDEVDWIGVESKVDAWESGPDFCSSVDLALTLVEDEDFEDFTLKRLESQWWDKKWEANMPTVKRLGSEVFCSAQDDNPARAIVLAYLAWKDSEDAPGR